MAKAETAVTLLTENRDFLYPLLKDLANRPINITQQLESNMNDNRQSIGNISNVDGVITVGNDNKIVNKINKSAALAPPELAQLKALLDQLDQTIKASAIPADDRAYALKQVSGMRDLPLSMKSWISKAATTTSSAQVKPTPPAPVSPKPPPATKTTAARQ